MATRSKIGIENPDGSVTGIYCHWDGYPKHNGMILLKHYTDEQIIRKLMKLGSLSSLGDKLGKKHSFDSSEHPHWCTAYGRDRGESDVQATNYVNRQNFSICNAGEEWLYLWSTSDNQWLCKPRGETWTPLVQLLQKTLAEDQVENHKGAA